MPIECVLLRNAPHTVKKCKHCGAENPDFLRGQIQSSWRRFFGLAYCAVICHRCKKLTGWESCEKLFFTRYVEMVHNTQEIDMTKTEAIELLRIYADHQESMWWRTPEGLAWMCKFDEAIKVLSSDCEKSKAEALRAENARLRARISDLQKQISNDQHPPYSAPDPDRFY